VGSWSASCWTGKAFEFEALGNATLKGFDEPVALYEVRDRRTKTALARGLKYSR
jgi:class 3 adenylate cyclase